MTTLAPICLFTYNRINNTKQTIEALKSNFLASESKLFIFSDGPKNEQALIQVKEVRDYLTTITGFKEITIYNSKENKGLANSIISGVSQIIKLYGKVIVLEDDLLSSKNFLDFMNKSLNFYKDSSKVKSINGFSLDVNRDSSCNGSDVFFNKRTYSWGWATWENCWSQKAFNKNSIKSLISKENMVGFNKECGQDMSKMLMASINGINDSWYVRWVFQHFLEKKYAVYPYKSKITNIGYGENATHCTTINVLSSRYDFSVNRLFNFDKNEKEDPQLNKIFLGYFTLKFKLIFRLKLLRSVKGTQLLIKDFKEKVIKLLR
jgi:hypothetical protein